MKKLNIFYTTLFFSFIFLIFRNWFLSSEIIGGDWPYLFSEMVKDYPSYFSIWNPGQGNGLGAINPAYFLGAFHGSTLFLSHATHISWAAVYKFSWFGLFIGLSIFSSMYLLKVVFTLIKFWQQIFAAMIFTTNTYILMVVSGGQMGVALAYSLAPLVLASYIKLIDKFNLVQQNFQLAIVAGLVLGAQVMFDPRIAYLTLIAVSVYYVFCIKYYAQKNILNTLYLLLNTTISLGIVLLLHAIWILPMLLLRTSPIPQGLASVDGFRFFSFADFSHAFSLLHPNWPENIFGKTYFLKLEFLLLPILAFSGLLSIAKFKDQKLKIYILFFAFLGLLGAFLAKGTNPPFEQVNRWLFTYIPGMNLFRDPTKWYLLIILSYSVLIPFSLLQISEKVSSIKYQVLGKKINMHNTYYIILATFLVFWLFLIHPALLGQLGGTFKKREVPEEYTKLKDFLYIQPDFFRTLWIPRQHRFSFASPNHLSVEAAPLFGVGSASAVLTNLQKSDTAIYLSSLGIKYIIVPFDPNGEIFVKDRKYDQVQYKNTIEELQKVPWLSRISGFEKIAVFKMEIFPKDRLWLRGNGKVAYKIKNESEYIINVSVDNRQILVFSQNYHPKWSFIIDGKKIPSQKSKEGLNEFILPTKGNYQGRIIFLADMYYNYGKTITVFSGITIIVFLFAMKRKKLYNTNYS